MLYVILAYDADGSAEGRLAHRNEHVAYWQSFGDRLKVAGRFLPHDNTQEAEGSMLFLETDSETAAREAILADPFSKRGVFSDRLVVKAVMPALGSWLNAG